MITLSPCKVIIRSKESLPANPTHLETDFDVHVTERTLWYAIRARDVARNMRDFLWKAMHDALRIGKFWENIPGYENRATCAVCGEQETLEHILLECLAPGQSVVWELVRQAVGERSFPMIPLTLGAILGAPALSVAKMLGKKVPAVDRYFQMLILISAHLIWCLRCERVIQWAEEPDRRHSKEEITRRWRKLMEKRVILDFARTSSRYGRRALGINLVKATWMRPERLSDERTEEPGVLVGSRAQGYQAGIG